MKNIDMQKRLTKLFLYVIILLFVNIANAQEKTCDIDPQKKKIIIATLCGQAGGEPAYRFSGDECAKKSITKILEESAVQINMYRICGDKEFAKKIREETVKLMRFMEALLPCTDEKFSLDKIMNERTQYVKQRDKGVSCNNAMASTLRRRKLDFEKMMKTANNQNMEKFIFEELGISINSDGSVVDR